MGEGAGFPRTGRHSSSISKESIAEAYTHRGRGSFRGPRPDGRQEEGAPRHPGSSVITEIPYLVQKSRLVEKIAELLNEKKLPPGSAMSGMKSAEDIRPRHRAEIARGSIRKLMMESLFPG